MLFSWLLCWFERRLKLDQPWLSSTTIIGGGDEGNLQRVAEDFSACWSKFQLAVFKYPHVTIVM
jgi:hypothetical protein